MHAATVDLMTKKARFESDTALAVAEAFDIAIQQAQLVTVSMLDVRLAEFRSYVDERFTRVDARFVEFEAKMDVRFVEFEAKMEVRFAEQHKNMLAQFATAKSENDGRFVAVDARIGSLEARFDRFEAAVDARFALHEAHFDKKLEALKAELVRWVFVVMLGNAAISAAVNALMNSFRHLR
jgi:hypothetical protein